MGMDFWGAESFEGTRRTLNKALDLVEKFDLSRWYWPIKITVHDEPRGLHFNLTQRVNDIAGSGKITTGQSMIWTWLQASFMVEHEQLFLQKLEYFIKDAVLHELAENLWFDGRRLTNPHKGTKLDVLVPGERPGPDREK